MAFSGGGTAISDGGGITSMTRLDKVRLIFERFDINGDGVLDRSELAGFVSAVNPTVQFTADQLYSTVDELLLSYADSLPRPSLGLSSPGLLHFYGDGAADLDLEFSILNPSKPNSIRSDSNSSIVSEPKHGGITYDSTLKALEELRAAFRKLIRASRPDKRSKDLIFCETSSEFGWSADLGIELDEKSFSFVGKERSLEFRAFLKQLEAIRIGIDKSPTIEETFAGHMAIGRALYDRRMFSQALESFKRASELKPADARLNFTMGNSHWSLGALRKARACYKAALAVAVLDSAQWSSLLPQIHVNLGITMEAEGLLINASEHYREAAFLCPTHYRALKLLGSALFGIGEHGEAEKALEEAVLLNPDYADAHCDLGAVLHAVGEEERAVLEFQKAIDLKPDHLDALYNLGSSYNNVGRYSRAAEMYGRVLAGRQNDWRAQLNHAVSLLGTGEAEEAKKALSEALRFSNRIELHNAILNLKQLQRKDKDGVADWIVADVSDFRPADENTTSQEWLLNALRIRQFQKITKLGLCDANLLKNQMEGMPVKSIRKAELELILRKLLHFLKPETFQSSIKAINHKICAALEVTGSGKVDLGMFLAIIAPICGGKPENRKRSAFDALSWRSMKDEEAQGQISRADASTYLRYLRVIYFSSQGFSDLMESHRGEDSTLISFPDFLNFFDDMDSGFGIMSTLVKLEADSNVRQSRQRCGVCMYRITGLMFKETNSRFCLCSSCYSECRVPSKFEKQGYEFKECRIR